MCRKLGKKAQKKMFGESYGVDLRRDPKTGKLRRNEHGRIIGQGYMSHALDAWVGLDCKFYPEQMVGPVHLTKSKEERLKKLDNLYMFEQPKARTYSNGEYARREAQLKRNHVSAVEN